MALSFGVSAAVVEDKNRFYPIAGSQCTGDDIKGMQGVRRNH